jgi:hypothetical protein
MLLQLGEITRDEETMMSIDPEVWRANIKDVLEQIADEEFQRQAWFNKLENVMSSPVEVVCQLYDDYLFERFVEDDKIGLSSDQRHAAREFAAMLSKFLGETPALDPHKLLADPRWATVRDEARTLVRLLF